MSMAYGRTAVLLDHHPLWLEAVHPIVTGVGGIVVGKETSGRRGLALVEEHRPDLLVTGIEMPDGDLDGIEVVRRAVEAVPTLRAIVLSLYDDSEHIAAAMAAGAVDYVLKKAHPDALRAATRQAFAHSRSLPGHPTSGGGERFGQADLRGLTRRECEILQLVAEGHSNAHVARMLWVTEQTVKFHLSNVYRKLNVKNRTEASRWAQLHGLLAAPVEVSGTENAASRPETLDSGFTSVPSSPDVRPIERLGTLTSNRFVI